MLTRRPLLALATLLAFALPCLAQKKIKLPKPGKSADIVFVGNSYTHFHQLPDFVRALGLADKPARKLTTVMLAPGGFTLQKHWQAKGSQAPATVIKERRPDYVVLQEQSRRPFEAPKLMEQAAQKFAKAAKKKKAVPVWFMTWARQQEPERQDEISVQYEHVHKQCGGLLAPVGRAWQRIRKREPKLELHMPDKSHPSRKGSYVAACVLYVTMFGGDVRSFPSTLRIKDANGKDKVLVELTPDEGALLREAAAQALQAMLPSKGKQRRR